MIRKDKEVKHGGKRAKLIFFGNCPLEFYLSAVYFSELFLSLSFSAFFNNSTYIHILKGYSKNVFGISIFVQNFHFCPEFPLLSRISIFVQNFHYCPEFSFLSRISIIVQNFHFCPEFPFLSRISIFVKNFYFCPEFPFLFRISIVVQNFQFCPCLVKISRVFKVSL